MSFGEEIENKYGDCLRTLIASYAWVFIGLLFIGIISILSPFFFPDNVTGVLFSHAALIAAVAFHLFSVGNSIYSVAVALGSRAIFEKGTKTSGNATIIAFSAGLLFIAGFNWNIPWQFFPLPGFLYSLSVKYTTMGIVALSQFILAVGLLLHVPQHIWYREVGEYLETNFPNE